METLARLRETLGLLVTTSLDRTGRLVTFVTVLIGLLVGAALSGSVKISDQDFANMSALTLLGGAIAFVVDLLFITPTRLLMRTRKAHEATAPTVINNYWGAVTMGPGASRDALPPPQPPPAPLGRPSWMDADEYEDRLVRVADLPMETYVVRGKTFRRCTLFGPAVIVLLGGGELNGTAFDGVPDEMLWEIPANRTKVLGPIAFENCRFISCRFVGIGIAGPKGLMDRFRTLPYNPSP